MGKEKCLQEYVHNDKHLQPINDVVETLSGMAGFREYDEGDKEEKDQSDDYPLYDWEPNQISTYIRTQPKIGRNDPCICGSGKKYKKCCLN